MGIVSRPVCLDADQLQHLTGLFLSLRSRYLFMGLDGLRNLLSHGHNRVQRGHRILENHGNMLSPDFPYLILVHFQNIFSVIKDFP